MPDIDQQQSAEIEPITPAKPIIFKTERQLAVHLTKTYGEAPVGTDLLDVWSVATEPYLTRAEQDAAIAAEILLQQPPAPQAEDDDPTAAWRKRCDKQNVIRVPLRFSDGTSGLSDINPEPRPKWANSVYDHFGDNASKCLYRSEPIVATPLLHDHGVVEADCVMPAFLQLHVFQDATGARPMVRVDRYAALNRSSKKVELDADSALAMSLAEATQLAHTLLAAVDLATGAGRDSE